MFKTCVFASVDSCNNDCKFLIDRVREIYLNLIDIAKHASFSKLYAKHHKRHSAEPLDYCLVSFMDYSVERCGLVALGAQRTRRLVFGLFDCKHVGNFGNPVSFCFQPETETEKFGPVSNGNI